LETVGIICEYNPLHKGHQKQLAHVRATVGPDGGIVCLMSGNFVQRGSPAIVDKMRRAKAAVLCGADLVLELPVVYALSSAEGFAFGGVGILSGFCQKLCFGAATADAEQLMALAQALLSPAFFENLRSQLDKGLSFPATRQAVLQAMGIDASPLEQPNNILAVEYCKAILSQGCDLEPMVIHREGSYHAAQANDENPSATAVRMQMLHGGSWQEYIPAQAAHCFLDAPLHAIAPAERAILAKLRCMTDAEFEALPYGSEGLWRKLMHAARSEATLDGILAAVKSKRYTRSRLDRMLMCAFLGITKRELETKAPYVRVLAFNDRGREILRQARLTGDFPNIGQSMEHPYQALENRCSDLYGLFSLNGPEAPGAEEAYRVFYHKP